MDIYEQFLKILEEAIDKCGNASRLAEKLGLPPNQITRWQRRDRAPNLTTIVPLMNLLGISFENVNKEPDKEICFVNAKMVDAAENAAPPLAEDYVAAPMVGEAGAGPGYLPENEIKSWFLVYKNLPAIRHRKNLIAVEIGKGSTSMQPTLNPGDIVLVDRDDRDVSRPNHIMLVMDPLDGSAMVKRVSVQDEKREILITYYSDNAAHFPPQVYNLQTDFDGDWDKAIIGRVIWAWSDMREK